MIISHKYQTVFLHIPKCAGTSIREALVQSDPDCHQMWGWRWMDRHQRYGDSAHMPLVDLPPNILDLVRNYTVIALTRDPLARFFSAIHQHFQQHSYRAKPPISDFLRELDSIKIRYDPAYVHFCPQHYFLYISTKKYVDHTLRIEDANWQEQFRTILIRQGFPQSKLDIPVLNERASRPDPEITDEDLSLFYRLYKRDYELLDYEAPLNGEYILHTKDINDAAQPLDFSSYDEVNFLGAKFRKFWPKP